MRHADFTSLLDDEKIAAAIKLAEAKTSAQIRVMVSSRRAPDALAAAKKQFLRLKMDRTSHRNGVLIFIAHASQTFAIVGDTGIDQHCGPKFWDEIANEMGRRFQKEAWNDALVDAIGKIGAKLSQHFPRDASDVNELLDKVERD